MERKQHQFGNRFANLSRGLRRKRGEMNRNEAEYAKELDANPEVYRWWFEPFSLRLSHPDAGVGASYCPDFLVLMTDGRTFVDDVKAKAGFDDNASIVRAKCAAEMFPLWQFRLIYARRKKDGGGWDLKEL